MRDFTHSGDGNLLTDTDYSAAPDYTYEYDQAGRLSAIRKNGALAATYGHDAFGRRVVRSVAGGPVVHYLFDASGKPLAEHDGTTGAVLREYIWIGDLMVGWSDGTGLSFVHGGHLGQPLVMTDAAGAVVWRAEYGPFGELFPSVTTQENDLRFPGQWADGESKLLQNWHRDYDPSLGRYIQADPIGLAAGQSLYGYVGADPVNGVDPMGLIGLCASAPAACVNPNEIGADAKNEMMDDLRLLSSAANFVGVGFIQDRIDTTTCDGESEFTDKDFVWGLVEPDIIDVWDIFRSVRRVPELRGTLPDYTPTTQFNPHGLTDQRFNHPSQGRGPVVRDDQ